MADWAFGPFELDDRRFELRRDGRPIELRRKVFDVLRYLIEHRDRLVTKDELMRELWPGVVVQEAVLTQNVAILRKVLGDSRQAGGVIQTVHGRGYRFVAEVVTRDAPTRSNRSPSQSPGEPFVGRDPVMRALRASLDEARAGAGRFVLVTGDAGIGKTRTLEALATEARAAGVRVLVGRAHDGVGAPPYWPWIQVLRAALGAPSTAVRRGGVVDDAQARSLLSTLEAGSAGAPAEDGASLGDARFRLFDDVVAWLGGLARKTPVLVALDDLHGSDDESLLLLRFVARETRSVPLLVVGAARDAEAGAPPAAAALTGLFRETHAERVYLTGLSLDAADELARGMLGRELAKEELQELHAVSEGNPFFLRELLQLFADERDPGVVRRELPRRVRELVALRTRTLGAAALDVLSAASVLGETFDPSVLESVAGIERGALLELLDATVRARVVRASVDATGRETSPARYSFAHGSIRQSFYEGLSERERTRLHDLAGRALEARHAGDEGPHLDALAHHAFLAALGGDPERAVSACVRAAEHAQAALAFERAVVQYERALRALQLRVPVDDARRFEIELALGGATFRAGGDGTPALLRAADAARRLGRPEGLAQVVLAMRGWPRVVRHGRTANPALAPLVAEALARSHAGEPALRARLLAAQAVDGPEETPIATRLGLAREAVDLARRASDDEALFDSLVARLRLPQAPDQVHERAAAADELVAVAHRLGRPDARFTAHALRVGPRMTLGRIAAVDEDVAACSALADVLRLSHARLYVLRLRLARAFGDGRFDDLRPLSREASTVRGPAQSTAGTAVTLFIWSAFARAYRGDRSWFERRIGDFESAVELGRSMRGFLAFLHASFERHDAARACYAPLLAPGALDAAPDDDWLMTTALVAEAAAACRDLDAARVLLAALRPHASLVIAHEEWLIYFGACSHWLGLLAQVLGDASGARSHFEAALEANRALGARAAVARTALALARLLLHSGGDASDEDRACGERLLREARALAEPLGLRPVLDEVAALSR